MTLLELSAQYEESERLIHARILSLRAQMRLAPSDEQARQLLRRIAELLPLRQESREIAQITAHYYDRRDRR